MKGHLIARGILGIIAAVGLSAVPAVAGPPVFEPAYANGQTVIISVGDAVDPHPGHVPGQAQNEYFEVIYPIGWEQLVQHVPQCNPCDHGGDGDDPFDYHDHVFAGEPGDPGNGVYGPLWRLSFVVPAYTQDETHNAAVSVAYAAHLPVTSAAAVQALLAAILPDGSPIAEWFDVDFVFRAAIVNANAQH
jgi:hypothetical protein